MCIEENSAVARCFSPRGKHATSSKRGLKHRATSVAAVAFVMVSLISPAARADDASEARLREALRNVTLQLRAVESDRASLQGASAALTDENKALGAKLEALKKDFAAERTATDKTIANLKAQLAARDAALAQAKESADKWEAGQKEAAALAATKESDRVKLAAENLELRRLVADREAKNLALFKVANEILTRYEKFSLGDALLAREPFIGRTRTKLENLVQDYEDKIDQQRAKP